MRLERRCPVCTEKSIHPDAGRICASDFASEHLIYLVQDRSAAWAEPTTLTETGLFSAESNFRYTQEYQPGQTIFVAVGENATIESFTDPHYVSQVSSAVIRIGRTLQF
jgi:hypothetical protein